MAKAREVPIDGAEPFAAAGARVVAARAQELFEHRENVLDTGDIERVHAMRVASRRLRAVLEIFAPCFERDLHRAVLRDVKAIADALGERRDPDVHIEALAQLDVPAAQRPAIEHLVTLQKTRQARGNEILAGALAEIDANDLRGRLERLVER